MVSPLNGKLALITGGSGTIGLAIAKSLVLQGVSVILVGRNMAKLEMAIDAVLAVLPETPDPRRRVEAFACDVTNERSVIRLFDDISLEFPLQSVNLLINNAGINVVGATGDLSASDFEKVMSVNVTGPFLCSREAMQRMELNGGGRIINIGSLSSMSPRPDSAPYTASKFALLGLTHSLSLDGRAHNIAVGIIHPGNVQSELLTPEMVNARLSEGFLQPEDVANCVVAMASLPLTANVLEMTVLPTHQPMMGRG